MKPAPSSLYTPRAQSGFATVVQTGFATALMLVINVVTGILSARYLGAQGRGELSALILVPQFLSFLFALGLPTALVVRAKSAPERAAGLMGAALLLSVATGALAAAVGFAIVPRMLAQYDAHIVTLARPLLVFVLFGVISVVLVAGLQLSERFLAFNRVRYWQSALVLLALIALVVMGAFTPTSGALAYLLPTLPFFIWMVWRVLRDFRPSLTGLRENCRELLSYGVRIYGTEIVATLLVQLDKVILVALLAPSLFGIYVVVFNLSRLVTSFAGSTLPVLLPRAAGRPLQEALTLTSRALSATTLLSAIAVAACVVLGIPVLRLLYGEQFAEGYWALVILALEAALAGGASILQQLYLVSNKPGTVTIFQAVALGVAAFLMYALAGDFGIEGAALALLSATFVRFWLTYSGYRRFLGVSAPRLIPTRDDCVALLGRLRSHAGWAGTGQQP